MTYIVKKFNGAYSPSYPYEGKDKEIAVRIAEAYIAQGASIFLIEQEDAKEGK